MPRVKNPKNRFLDVDRKKILESSINSLWSKEGESVLNFLKNERHLSDFVIKQFKFGWCPKDIVHELSGRVIMPFFDSYGEEIIAFTSRDFDAPKQFQHWHETFDKSDYLYGLHIAKKPIIKNNLAIVVEGQFDVTCLHGYGLNNTVGVCGSSLSITQMILLRRYCSRVVLIFDPDKSGDSATSRTINMFKQWRLEKNAQLYAIKLPGGLDPDEFVVQFGKEQMMKLIDEKIKSYEPITS